MEQHLIDYLEIFLEGHDATIDTRMPWFTLRYGPVSSVRLNAQTYVAALNEAVFFLKERQ